MKGPIRDAVITQLHAADFDNAVAFFNREAGGFGIQTNLSHSFSRIFLISHEFSALTALHSFKHSLPLQIPTIIPSLKNFPAPMRWHADAGLICKRRLVQRGRFQRLVVGQPVVQLLYIVIAGRFVGRIEENHRYRTS